MSICKECNKEFVKKSYQQEYCDGNCKIKASRKRTLSRKHKENFDVYEQNKIAICPICRKEFEREFSNAWRLQKYCSHTCKHRANKLPEQQVSNTYHKDMIRFNGNKHHTLIRDSFKCQFCKSDIQLVVHHLDGSGHDENPNNDMDNLITLCKSCHARLHQCINKYKYNKINL